MEMDYKKARKLDPVSGLLDPVPLPTARFERSSPGTASTVEESRTVLEEYHTT